MTEGHIAPISPHMDAAYEKVLFGPPKGWCFRIFRKIGLPVLGMVQRSQSVMV
jgi:hypothetical protein